MPKEREGQNEECKLGGGTCRRTTRQCAGTCRARNRRSSTPNASATCSTISAALLLTSTVIPSRTPPSIVSGPSIWRGRGGSALAGVLEGVLASRVSIPMCASQASTGASADSSQAASNTRSTIHAPSSAAEGVARPSRCARYCVRCVQQCVMGGVSCLFELFGASHTTLRVSRVHVCARTRVCRIAGMAERARSAS